MNGPSWASQLSALSSGWVLTSACWASYIVWVRASKLRKNFIPVMGTIADSGINKVFWFQFPVLLLLWVNVSHNWASLIPEMICAIIQRLLESLLAGRSWRKPFLYDCVRLSRFCGRIVSVLFSVASIQSLFISQPVESQMLLLFHMEAVRCRKFCLFILL